MCYYANKLEQGGVHAHTMFALFENGISMLQSECLEMVSGMMACKRADFLCVKVFEGVLFRSFFWILFYYILIIIILLLLLLLSIIIIIILFHRADFTYLS